MSLLREFNKINLRSRIVEIVILFLAVTIGFVVDEYRDEYSEKKNSKELLLALKIDLEKDLGVLMNLQNFVKL